MGGFSVARGVLKILLVVSCVWVAFNFVYFGFYGQQGVMFMTLTLWFVWVFVAVGIDSFLEKRIQLSASAEAK